MSLLVGATAPLILAGHTSPSAALANVPGFNTLKYDSFVTIGRKLDDDPLHGVDVTQVVLLDPWTDTRFTGGTEPAWFITGFPPQGQPGAPDKVLIGQFTVANPGPNADVFVQMFVDGIHTNAGGVVERFQIPVVVGPRVCPADLDGNGNIEYPDLLTLLAAWDTYPDGPPDFNGDGVVGVPDLLTLLAAWGACQ